jgi:SAM-dependent methyltransferase
MNFVKQTRRTLRGILGPRVTALVRRPFRPKLRALAGYRSDLQAKRALEIGGPSPLLAHDGQIPVYDVLRSLDNCLYSGTTIWTGEVAKGNTFYYHPGKPPGAQIIAEASDLWAVQDSTYECLLACHCLEHVANPLRALAEWTRVLKDDGLLLLILPHKDATFDWRRPVTPLAHMIEDYERARGEDDLTHLAEVLELHDLSKDEGGGTKDQFRQRALANNVNRAMHHHVFDTRAALTLLDYAALQVLRVDYLKPYHIIILARRTNRTPDNSNFLAPESEHWRCSPFPSDSRHRSS